LKTDRHANRCPDFLEPTVLFFSCPARLGKAANPYALAERHRMMVLRLWISGIVAYTLGYMRRTIAVFMLLIFGSFLSAPLLVASSNPSNNLPACCRRTGKHHCMMRLIEDDSGTTQVSAPPEKCPFFPQTWQETQVQKHFIAPDVAESIYAALQSHPACHVQSDAQQRISFDRSRQKRGPPAALVAS